MRSSLGECSNQAPAYVSDSCVASPDLAACASSAVRACWPYQLMSNNLKFSSRLLSQPFLSLTRKREGSERDARASAPSWSRRVVWWKAWSAMTYQQVWLRRLSVAIAKQEAIATLVRVPLVTRHLQPDCYGCGCVR